MVVVKGLLDYFIVVEEASLDSLHEVLRNRLWDKTTAVDSLVGWIRLEA